MVNKRLRNQAGQMVLSEYVVIFFIVIAAIVTMTLYVQRGLQARTRDARVYMINAATAACAEATTGNVDCLGAANAVEGKLKHEYEPYYGLSESLVSRNALNNKTLDETNRTFMFSNSETQIQSTSKQRPPAEAR